MQKLLPCRIWHIVNTIFKVGLDLAEPCLTPGSYSTWKIPPDAAAKSLHTVIIGMNVMAMLAF